MSNRFIGPTQILPPTSVSNGNTYTSIPLDMRTISRGAIEIDYSSGFVADFFLQASVSGQAGTYENLNVALASANNSAGTSSIDLSVFGYAWFQIVAVVTSGSGTLTVWANAKGF